MIRFDMIRNKNNLITVGSKKFQTELCRQIDKGIVSSPFKETQKISIEIYDKPILRKLAEILEIGEDLIKVKAKTIFVRSHVENNKKLERKFVFEDKFSGDQLTLLKSGNDIVDKKGSFLNQLTENINRAISE